MKKRASKFYKWANVEFHEVRQRTATMQCPQCSSYLEEGFPFCKCGAGLKMDESTISRIRKRFQDVLGSSYFVLVTGNRGKKHGNEQYQVDHAKAQDTLRNVLKDRKYESILKSFQKDSRCRESQIPHGWDEAYWWYVDFMASIDISHKASHGQRDRCVGSAEKETTNWVLWEQEVMLCLRKKARWQNTLQKKTGAEAKLSLQNWKKLLTCLADWKTHFASDRSSPSASSSTSWDNSWWSGHSKWSWKDDDWREH